MDPLVVVKSRTIGRPNRNYFPATKDPTRRSGEAILGDTKGVFRDTANLPLAIKGNANEVEGKRVLAFGRFLRPLTTDA